MKKIKTILLALFTSVTLASCAELSDVLLESAGIATTPRYEIPEFNLDDYKKYGSTMTCREIGNIVSQSYLLSKKGMSQEDIYWEISPMNATYVQQKAYLLFISMGPRSDASNYNVHEQACNQELNTYQMLLDQQSEFLYAYVNAIYKQVYVAEVKAFREGIPYGKSKNAIFNITVTNAVQGAFDDITHDVTILAKEQTLRLLYPEGLMDGLIDPRKHMPTIEKIRRDMAPQLAVTIKKS